MVKRTGIEGLYIAVRGDVEHYNQAKVFCTEKAARFLNTRFGIDPRWLALQLESFVVADLPAGECLSNKLLNVVETGTILDIQSVQRTRPQEVSECRKLIQEGLRKL
jgi:hypothetical protein